MYPIIHVPEDASELPEQLGTKFKFWYRLEDQILRMFKEGRPNTGENWAEKVCAEIAAILDIPHAEYDLAQWHGRYGVVTPMFVPDGGRLVLGNEMLGKIVKGYSETARYRAREHTLTIACAVMRWYDVPVHYEAPRVIHGALPVFIGYLMLDALVGNQDRHHHNWGIVFLPDRQITVAPTFDHAASLGRNESDRNRSRRLETTDKGFSVATYCARARSGFYEKPSDGQTMTTHDVFRAAAKIDRDAAKYWLSRLQSTTVSRFDEIIGNVPRQFMSNEAASFALEMLTINRQILLDTAI